MNILILYSAGLDSVIMRHYAKIKYPNANVSCVYYAHGAESEEAEIAALPDFVDVKYVDWLDENNGAVAKKGDTVHGKIYIPGRNMVLFTLAACQYLPDEIWMGTLFDEDHPHATDKNVKFREDVSSLASYVLSPFLENDVKLRYPFVEEGWYKKDIVEWALSTGINKQDILDSTSCWHNDGTPCGECNHCFKRRLMLHYNDIEDTNYKVDPMKSPKAEVYIDYFRNNPEALGLERDEFLVLFDYWDTGIKTQPSRVTSE